MTWSDLINVITNALIGITAIVSLWFSIKTLKKSDWDSAMTTSPSLVLRPTHFWVGQREREKYHGYSVVEQKNIIKAESDPFEIAFSIEFECFNAGRGVAFNISKPISNGLQTSPSQDNRIPLYQTLEDAPFRFSLSLVKKFKEWYSIANEKIPVRLEIFYTNDQNNIYCRSNWQADIRPFELEEDNLKVREIRVLNRNGKIQYSTIPYKNHD